MSTEEPATKDGNGNSSTAIAKLLNQLNLPTLAMVMLMGGGNWFATNNQGNENRSELDRVRAEVRDEVREIHRNQDQYVDNVRRVKENQEALRQILQILENQQKALDILKSGHS